MSSNIHLFAEQMIVRSIMTLIMTCDLITVASMMISVLNCKGTNHKE